MKKLKGAIAALGTIGLLGVAGLIAAPAASAAPACGIFSETNQSVKVLCTGSGQVQIKARCRSMGIDRTTSSSWISTPATISWSFLKCDGIGAVSNVSLATR